MNQGQCHTHRSVYNQCRKLVSLWHWYYTLKCVWQNVMRLEVYSSYTLKLTEQCLPAGLLWLCESSIPRARRACDSKSFHRGQNMTASRVVWRLLARTADYCTRAKYLQVQSDTLYAILHVQETFSCKTTRSRIPELAVADSWSSDC